MEKLARDQQRSFFRFLLLIFVPRAAAGCLIELAACDSLMGTLALVPPFSSSILNFMAALLRVSGTA
jgi:hypothetical protein